MAVLGFEIMLMIRSHKRTPPHEQVARIRLKRAICTSQKNVDEGKNAKIFLRETHCLLNSTSSNSSEPERAGL